MKNNMRNLVTEYRHEIKGQIEVLEDVLRNAPEGYLRICRRGGRISYYVRSSSGGRGTGEPGAGRAAVGLKAAEDESGAGRAEGELKAAESESGAGRKSRYIPAADSLLLRRYADKRLASAALPGLRKNLKAAEAFLLRYGGAEIRDYVAAVPQEYHQIRGPLYKTFGEDSATWAAEDFEQSSLYPERKIFQGISGEKYRSKSELIIADVLGSHCLPNRYECALQIRATQVIYPDFTILNPRDGRIWYWEHFGLMSNSAYSRAMCRKLVEYQSIGVWPGDGLVFTLETDEQPFDRAAAEAVVGEYFL